MAAHSRLRYRFTVRAFGAIALVCGCSFHHGLLGGGPTDGPPLIDARIDTPIDAAITTDGDAMQVATCPTAYSLHDSARPMSFYRWVSASASWTSAESTCEGDASPATRSTHLIVLDDDAERAWAFAQNNSDQWVGMADNITEQTWLAVTDQPNPYVGNASGNLPNKDCMYLNTNETVAEGCTTGHPYLCECDSSAVDSTHF
jgi:hypothetical protein